MNIVLIGATSAIAQEVARHYAHKSASLFIAASNSHRLESIKEDLITHGAALVTTFCADLRNCDTYLPLAEKITQAHSTIDLLIIAQGVLPEQKSFENMGDSIFGSSMVNYVSAAWLLNHFAPLFERQHYGRIAVITSVAGVRGRRSNYLYGSQKAALQTFLQGYAARLRPSGIKVLDIRPGLVSTPMTKHMKKSFLFSDPSVVARDIIKAIDQGKSLIYTPFYWRYIMLLVRAMPRWLLERLKV